MHTKNTCYEFHVLFCMHTKSAPKVGQGRTLLQRYRFFTFGTSHGATWRDLAGLLRDQLELGGNVLGICVCIPWLRIEKLPDWLTANGIRDNPLVPGGMTHVRCICSTHTLHSPQWILYRWNPMHLYRVYWRTCAYCTPIRGCKWCIFVRFWCRWFLQFGASCRFSHEQDEQCSTCANRETEHCRRPQIADTEEEGPWTRWTRSCRPPAPLWARSKPRPYPEKRLLINAMYMLVPREGTRRRRDGANLLAHCGSFITSDLALSGGR